MNLNPGIGENRLPEGLLSQMEPSLTDSRPPSVAVSDSDDESYGGEVWDDIDGSFEMQEGDSVEQGETALLGVPGPLFDTPVIPVVKRPNTPTSPTLSFQCQSVVPSLVSSPSLSPSVSPLKPHLRPLHSIRPIIPDPKGDYQMHIPPPHPHVLLPSHSASVVSQSAMTTAARESPSRRFFASSDQIDALGKSETWIQGQVITTLGDTFCYTSCSKPKPKRYTILPSDLFELWDSYMGGHIASRTSLSFHFKQAASPLECRAWLVPVLLEHHWYLLAFDWIDHALRIYDSLAMSKTHPTLVKFGSALLDFITEDFDLKDSDWNVVPEQVSGFIVAWPDSDLLISVAVAKIMTMIAGCMSYGIYTASHIMEPLSCDLLRTSRLGVPHFMNGFGCLAHTNTS